jgi:hypothetical protein
VSQSQDFSFETDSDTQEFYRAVGIVVANVPSVCCLHGNIEILAARPSQPELQFVCKAVKLPRKQNPGRSYFILNEGLSAVLSASSF